MTKHRCNKPSIPHIAPVLLLGMFALTWTPTSSATDTLTQGVGVSVESVAQMAIRGIAIPAFIVSSADTAGGVPSIAKDPHDRYLQFTSIAPTGESRSLQAQLNADAPAGMAVLLSTSSVSGTGAVGVAQYTAPGEGAALLSTTPVDLVTGIGTGYTGNGPGDGLLLNYELFMTDQIDQVGIGTQTLEVTFTLASAP